MWHEQIPTNGICRSKDSDEYVEIFELPPERHQDATPRKRSIVDFAAVPVSQWKMHDRLENWARWSHGASGEGARITISQPMFGLYRSSEAKRSYGEETSVPIDKDDALVIHFAIIHPTFDPQKRKALQWAYLIKRNPSRAAAELGVDLQQLADLICEGRALLISRGV